MSECPRCYVYRDLDGRNKIQYCSLHALAPWMAQWIGEMVNRQNHDYISGLEQTSISTLQDIGALDMHGKITEWVKEIKHG